MGSPLTPTAATLLGGLLLALPAAAAAAETIFLTEGYRYVPGAKVVDEGAADVGLALCGKRCNALSTDFQSYLMTMGWRLTKVGGVTERVVDLGNPFLDGQCVCTGEEYRVEYYSNRSAAASTPGAQGPTAAEGGTNGGRAGGAGP